MNMINITYGYNKNITYGYNKILIINIIKILNKYVNKFKRRVTF